MSVVFLALLGASCKRDEGDSKFEIVSDPTFTPTTTNVEIFINSTNELGCFYENNFINVHVDSLTVTENSWYIIRDGQKLLLGKKASQKLVAEGEYVLRYKQTDSLLIVERDINFEVVYCLTQIKFADAFSPNGDGEFDEWEVITSGVERYSCVIEDKEGENVFTSSDENEAWNGRLGEKEMSTGTYSYLVEGAFKNGTLFEYRGTVELVR